MAPHEVGSAQGKVMFVATIGASLGRFVAPIAREAAEGGFEIIGVAQGSSAVGDLFDRTYELPDFRRRGIRAHWAALRALTAAIKAERPDVIHLNTPSAVLLGRLAGAWCRVPTISVIHGTFLEPVGLRALTFAAIEAPFAWLSAAIVVLNEQDRRFYAALSPKRVVVIAPAGGAGLSLDAPDASGSIATTPPRATYLGRFAADKNLDTVIAAWRAARRRIPDLELHLIGGNAPGDPPWDPPSFEGLHVSGWTTSVSHEICSAVCVITASEREGYSMVVAEAAALGVPVVAFANRGTRQIAPQAPELISLVSTVESMSARLIELSERPRAQRPARNDLLDRWSTSAVVAFHVAVIATVIADAQVPAR